MNKLVIPGLAAALLLVGCTGLGGTPAPPTGAVPSSVPMDAAGAQQAFEAAIGAMGVEQVARAQINDSRLVIYGLTDSGSTEAVVYNTEWGATEPSITTEPLEPLGIGPIVPAAEVDFGAGYEKARAAMSTCNQEIAYSWTVAMTGQPLTQGLCGGTAGEFAYGSIADQEFAGSVPDFSTVEGASQLLAALKALGVDQVERIGFVDDLAFVQTLDQSVAGPGGQCIWRFGWSTDQIQTFCKEPQGDTTPFAFADINQEAFPAAVADVYAHSGALANTGATVEWNDELGTAIIYTLLPPDIVYGYRIDGTPLQ